MWEPKNGMVALVSLSYRTPLCSSVVSAVVPVVRMRSSIGVAALPSPNDAIGSVKCRKQTLRKEMRRRLKEISEEEIIDQSKRAFERLQRLEVYQKSSSIGVFLSMPSGELQTEALIEGASRSGKTIYVPQVGSSFEKPDMDLLKVPSSTRDDDELFYHNWPRNKWAIPEPPAGLTLQPATPGDIDLLIVPGLAFDRDGKRLGQGKGYYDRFIARMCANDSVKSPVLMAVGLQCQLIESRSVIPIDEHDASVDYVVVPDAVITVGESFN